VAWWLKLQARHHRVHSETVRKLTFNQPLSVAEVEKAENSIVAFVRRGAYPRKYRILLNSCVEAPNVPEKLTKSSSFWRHHPIMSPTDKLMHVNSRLTDALLSNEFKFPAIVPAHCHVAKLVVTHFHEQSVDMGSSYVLSKIRQKYWIVRGHAFVRSVLKVCFSCKLDNKAPEKQIMAPLLDFKHRSG
jgi:hypothetical protein